MTVKMNLKVTQNHQQRNRSIQVPVRGILLMVCSNHISYHAPFMIRYQLFLNYTPRQKN